MQESRLAGSLLISSLLPGLTFHAAVLDQSLAELYSLSFIDPNLHSARNVAIRACWSVEDGRGRYQRPRRR
jgi:hypothetical protein